MTETRTVAVIGLGSMGYGVAASILRAGHRTHGIDVNPDRVAQFRAEGGTPGRFPEIGAQVDAVVLVVINAAQVQDILFGAAGIVPALRDGTAVICCSTVAPEFARRMEVLCSEHGLSFLDAPISGGPEQAAEGALSVMAAGSAAAFAAARPVLEAMAQDIFEMGESAGAGSAMKAVNQLLTGVHIAAAAEAMTFAMTQGIDPQTFLDVIARTPGTSYALESRGPRMATGDLAPYNTVDVWRKDLGIVQDIARAAGFSAPLASTALQQFLAAAGTGLGRKGDAAIVEVYARNAGLTRPEESGDT